MTRPLQPVPDRPGREARRLACLDHRPRCAALQESPAPAQSSASPGHTLAGEPQRSSYRPPTDPGRQPCRASGALSRDPPSRVGLDRRPTSARTRGYDSADFVADLRQATRVTAHVACAARHPRHRRTRTTAAAPRASPRRSQKIEGTLPGWAKHHRRYGPDAVYRRWRQSGVHGARFTGLATRLRNCTTAAPSAGAVADGSGSDDRDRSQPQPSSPQIGKPSRSPDFFQQPVRSPDGLSRSPSASSVHTRYPTVSCPAFWYGSNSGWTAPAGCPFFL